MAVDGTAPPRGLASDYRVIALLPLVPISAAASVQIQPASATAGPEIIVTASRVQAATNETPYSVTIIPKSAIVGRESVADALSENAEMYVQAPGGRAGQAAIFLRGADPNFTAVLLDGIPLNNAANALGGAVNVSEIASAGIERIEVVAGGLSSLYGSGALAGAVNLVLSGGGTEHALETSAGFGTVEDYTGFARWRGPVAVGLGGSLAVTYDDAGNSAPFSSFRSASIMGKFAPLDTSAGGRAVFRLADTRTRAFPEASGGDRFAVLRELERRDSRETLLGASRPFTLGSSFRLNLSGSYLKRRDRTSSPGVAPSQFSDAVPGGEDETRYRRAIAEAALRYDGGEWQGVVGIESQSEVARSAGELAIFGMQLPSGFRGNRRTHSAFFEAARTTSNWLVNAGARLDRVEGFGAHVTGRFGIRYRVAGSKLSLRASAGTGFKAPSFYALGNPFVGNPDLAPERSRTTEVAMHWTDGAGNLSLAAFHSRFTNLIDFVPDPFPHLENRAIVISKGVSAAASRSFGKGVTARVQLRYSDTRDRRSGERLFNRPRWGTSSILTWQLNDKLAITGRHQFVGNRRAFSVPTGISRLSAYHSLTIEGSWAIRSEMVVRLIANNALNGDNEDAVGFTSPGRRARLIVEKRF